MHSHMRGNKSLQIVLKLIPNLNMDLYLSDPVRNVYLFSLAIQEKPDVTLSLYIYELFLMEWTWFKTERTYNYNRKYLYDMNRCYT